MQAANFVICFRLPATENATPTLSLPPLAPVSALELPAPALGLEALVVGLDIVVVPRSATPGIPEPPQPAASVAITVSPAPKIAARRNTHERYAFALNIV
jgi:hypothetical protein